MRTLLRVLPGQRQRLGILWRGAWPAGPGEHALCPAGEVFDALPPLTATWLAPVGFGASDYQRSIGKLSRVVPMPELRKLSLPSISLRLARLVRKVDALAQDSRGSAATLVLGVKQQQAQADCDALGAQR